MSRRTGQTSDSDVGATCQPVTMQRRPIVEPTVLCHQTQTVGVELWGLVVRRSSLSSHWPQ